ncbi:MAG: hypothetical protein V7637_3025 [Mycobacteriales bacterium]|jgi:hypothetical protein
MALAMPLTAVVAALAVAAQPARAAEAADAAAAGRPVPTAVTGWTLLDHSSQASLVAAEGVMTVTAAGATSVRYRGVASIPLAVAAEGWTHIGDPDAAGGYIVDAYQGAASGGGKMFRVTTPAGQSYEYVHTLVAGELFNNSFATVAPDGQWMVAGEWETMTHLQVYPTPLLNPRTAPTGGPLPLAGTIELDHPVRDVQGCDFVTATRLLCASDDSTGQLWPDTKPLLQVDLPGPLTGTPTTGRVTDLGPIPQQSICSGTFETEGVDYEPVSRQLRVQMVPPSVCAVITVVYRYQN